VKDTKLENKEVAWIKLATNNTPRWGSSKVAKNASGVLRLEYQDLPESSISVSMYYMIGMNRSVLHDSDNDDDEYAVSKAKQGGSAERAKKGTKSRCFTCTLSGHIGHGTEE
jgi:hypothetical protein